LLGQQRLLIKIVSCCINLDSICSKSPVKVLPVNWDSWSVLKISGLPFLSALRVHIPRNQHPRCLIISHASTYRLVPVHDDRYDIIRLRPLQNLLPAGNTARSDWYPTTYTDGPRRATDDGGKQQRVSVYFHRSNPFSTKSFSDLTPNLVSPDIIILPLLAHSIGVMYQRVRVVTSL